MADITKTSLQSKMVSTWEKQENANNDSSLNMRFKITKNLVQGFLGIALMTIWLILSVQQDQFLLGEIIPAYIIITALLFMKALDTKRV